MIVNPEWLKPDVLMFEKWRNEIFDMSYQRILMRINNAQKFLYARNP